MAKINNDLVTYYKDRAQEYEKIYSKPERQGDLQKGIDILQKIFAGKTVHEIACGTGYWTEKISKTAKSVLGTDINEAVLEIAREKDYGKADVRYEQADVFTYKSDSKFDSLFGGFIWSHIKLEGLKQFLTKVNEVVEPGGTVVFMDNKYVEGSSTPVTKTDAAGNTYQSRHLEDGSIHLVLKNFPGDDFLTNQVKHFGKDIQYIGLDYFWILIYTKK
jgi:2-polyprenyl-3-methyl-5-hydroxy-6-metoxy-1,4-benzoquinol methylase